MMGTSLEIENNIEYKEIILCYYYGVRYESNVFCKEERVVYTLNTTVLVRVACSTVPCGAIDVACREDRPPLVGSAPALTIGAPVVGRHYSSSTADKT
ncbi:hypothetical protein QE152_g280 [Popillia japonica]|uniref:Uncharacterized protein n=1 Tax=Popillia japonica TaxID=7064 RepID=A0AAW1NBM6_POPJA